MSLEKPLTSPSAMGSGVCFGRWRGGGGEGALRREL